MKKYPLPQKDIYDNSYENYGVKLRLKWEEIVNLENLKL